MGLGKGTLPPIRPFETRTSNFAQQDENITISVKLNFRNLPPYFVRRLAQAESGQFVQLGSLLSLDVITMANQFLHRVRAVTSRGK